MSLYFDVAGFRNCQEMIPLNVQFDLEKILQQPES